VSERAISGVVRMRGGVCVRCGSEQICHGVDWTLVRNESERRGSVVLCTQSCGAVIGVCVCACVDLAAAVDMCACG
jgi:hypothetical protein